MVCFLHKIVIFCTIFMVRVYFADIPVLLRFSLIDLNNFIEILTLKGQLTKEEVYSQLRSLLLLCRIRERDFSQVPRSISLIFCSNPQVIFRYSEFPSVWVIYSSNFYQLIRLRLDSGRIYWLEKKFEEIQAISSADFLLGNWRMRAGLSGSIKSHRLWDPESFHTLPSHSHQWLIISLASLFLGMTTH